MKRNYPSSLVFDITFDLSYELCDKSLAQLTAIFTGQRNIWND